MESTGIQEKFLPAIPAEPVAIVENGADVRIRPDAFSGRSCPSVVPSGVSVLSGLRGTCRMHGISTIHLRHARVAVNGIPLPHHLWADTVVREGDRVSCAIPMQGGGGGGKNPLRTVLMLTVVALATAATVWLGGAGGLLAGTEMGLGWSVAAANFTASMVGSAILMGGMMLVNAIAPASTPKLSLGNSDNESAAKVWSIDGAQNKADPYGTVPAILGFVRFAPRFASGYYSTISGNSQYVRYLYCVAGDCDVSDPRIGDTRFSAYTGSSYKVHANWTGQEKFTWFQHAVSEESLGILVRHSGGWDSRTTADNTERCVLFLSFGNGLKKIRSDGDSESASVELRIRYRERGKSEWTGVTGSRSTGGGNVRIATSWESTGTTTVGILADGTVDVGAGLAIASVRWHRESDKFYGANVVVDSISKLNGFTGSVTSNGYSLSVSSGAASSTEMSVTYTGRTVTPQRKAFEIRFPYAANWEVGVYRVTPDANKDEKDYTMMDEVTWTSLQSWRDRPAIVYQGVPLTVIEVQLKASEELSGSVNEFNCLFKTRCDIWNGSAWSYGVTNNPAALGMYVARGCLSNHPATDDELDLDSWGRFYRWCANFKATATDGTKVSHPLRYNAVITSQTNAGEILHNILAAGRGSYALLDGHGVVWDDPDGKVVDVITQRNSWNFQSRKSLLRSPVQALRMRFLNERMDWQEDEMVVYADGYDERNTGETIEWEQDGVTDPDLIHLHGRLRLAELKLRLETFTFNCEAESLTLVRGDRFRCVHDATFWGVGAGRIVSVVQEGDLVVGFDIDEELSMTAGLEYGCNIQLFARNGADAYFSLKCDESGVTRRMNLAVGIPVSATIRPQVGCMCAVGRTKSVGSVLMVTSIAPSDGLTAQVTAVEAAPEVYEAIEGPIPEFDSKITYPTRYQKGRPPVPHVDSIVSDESVLKVVNGEPVSRMLVAYSFPVGAKVPDGTSVVCYLQGLRDESWARASCEAGDGFVYVDGVEDGKYYFVKLAAVSDSGVMSEFSDVHVHRVVGKTSPPPDVRNFRVDVDPTQGFLLSWDDVGVSDLSHYEVTYYREGYDYEAETVRAAGNTLTLVLRGVVGRIVFKCVAVDTGGRKSVNPATVTVAVSEPANVEWTYRVEDNGIYIEWDAEAVKGTFDIDHFVLTDYWDGSDYFVKNSPVLLPLRPEGSYYVYGRAFDAFGNESPIDYFTNVVVGTPALANIRLGTDDGGVRVHFESYSAAFDKVRVTMPDGEYRYLSAPGSIPVYGMAGDLTFTLESVSKWGDIGEAETVSVHVDAPAAPVVVAEVSADGISLDWACVQGDWRIDHFLVTDGSRTWKVSDTHVILPPVDVTGDYVVSVTAVDAFDNAGETTDIAVTVAAIEMPELSVTVDGENLEFAWTSPTSPFRISGYVLTYSDGSVMAELNALSFTRRAPRAGTHSFEVRAVDVAGRRSAPGAASIVLTGPKTPSVTVAVDGTNVTASWKAVPAMFPIDRYEIVCETTDTVPVAVASASQKGTSFTMPAPRAGSYRFRVRAVDAIGNASQYGAYVVTLTGPDDPVVTVVTDGEQLVVKWARVASMFPLDFYEVVSEDGERVEHLKATECRFLGPREGTWAYTVRAVDVVGNASGPVRASITLGRPAAPTPSVRFDGTQAVVSWNAVQSSFAVSRYEVDDAEEEDLVHAFVNATEYRFEAPSEGTYNLRVRAYDVVGNVGDWSELAMTVNAPAPPVVLDGFPHLNDAADGIVLAWSAPASDLPIVGYDVVRRWSERRGDGHVEEMSADYGRIDATEVTVPAFAIAEGVHDILVRAVDNSGNVSEWTRGEVMPTAPGQVTFFDCLCIDNNVQLYYTAPSTVFFAIREFLIEEVEEYDDGSSYGMEIGRVDAHFFSEVRHAAGRYTYRVTPVDVGGNLGVPASIAMNVSQPPDFVLYCDVDSLFNGERTDMELDGRGSMIGPVPVGETWSENIGRVSVLTGVPAGDVTWSVKTGGGHTHWLAPMSASGACSYVETIDVGTVVPSSNIRIDVTSSTLDGSPVMTCRIEVSGDGESWDEMVENGTACYASQFRYIRATYGWSGGTVAVANIHYTVDVKKLTDFGRVEVMADDNGEGWISEARTPMLTGKWVPFVVGFTDVQSFPRPNIVRMDDGGDVDGLTAYVVFEDVLNPDGFRVYVKDRDGVRRAATVDWAAYGV